jgi:hypothetical protein
MYVYVLPVATHGHLTSELKSSIFFSSPFILRNHLIGLPRELEHALSLSEKVGSDSKRLKFTERLGAQNKSFMFWKKKTSHSLFGQSRWEKNSMQVSTLLQTSWML